MERTTKIIATIGPSSLSEDVLLKLLHMGMDVVRINYSHATHEQLVTVKKVVAAYNTTQGKDIKILMDLQGPRIRVGKLPEKGIPLVEGQEIILSTDPKNTEAIFLDDPYLHENIEPEHPIYLANGDMELTVVSKKNTEITTRVVRGGRLYSRKGVNVPETNLTTSGLTDKDTQDLAFGIKENVDYVALSFVQDAADVERARKLIAGTNIQIVSKIETKQSVINIDEIIDASDIIMIARGDLGIELPLEELPLIQKDIIRRANKKNKPCIVATQMLMSMTTHYRPTRAEISDAANAVLDGAKYLMLSDETASGNYPVEAVEYLVKTIGKVEAFQNNH